MKNSSMKVSAYKLALLAIFIFAVILMLPASSCIEKSAHEKQLQPDFVLEWAKTYGDGSGESVQQTSDDGYIVCGGSRGHLLLMKLDGQGNKLWDRKFDNDQGKSVQQTLDGGYIACGPGGWLIKTDGSGNKLWDKTFEKGYGEEVVATTDGYIICGWTRPNATDSEIRLIKTDKNGDKLWDKNYEKGQGHSILLSEDDDYLICGESYVSGVSSLSNLDILLIKIDQSGNQLWERKLAHGLGQSLKQDKDGKYIVCGTAYSSDTDSTGKIMLAKTDVNGNKLWEKTYGNEELVRGHAAYPTTDGGYLIFGDAIYSRKRSWSPSCAPGMLPPQVNLWLIKTDSQGNKLWDTLFEDYSINSIQPTADGGFVLCGSSEREYPEQILVLKFSLIR
jgi:hypothetical protein